MIQEHYDENGCEYMCEIGCEAAAEIVDGIKHYNSPDY